MVRYRVKPDRVAEHEALIGEVFVELARLAPPGLRYGAFRQPDGVSFVHVAVIEGEKNPLEELAAFREFTAGIKDRCDEPPVAVALATLGAYGL